MKYAIVLSLVGVMAVVAGCSDDTNKNDTTSASSSSSGAGGEGGMGTGGMGTGGMGTGGMGTGGMGTGGGPTVCDNATVVDEVDPAKRCQTGVPTEVVNVIMATPAMKFADSVVAFSSQYQSVDWSADQAKGLPDVYPASGDEPKAWAQGTLDMAGEYITVGWTTPVVAEAVWIYETNAPGAISKVTVTAADGDHVVYTNASPAPIGTCSHILSVSTKTCSPIAAVRIDIAGDKVPGYNEIDAVGLVPPK